jgi:hypothetical protein
MDTSILFSQMIQMFLMIFLGYFLRKVKLLDQVFTGKLTSLLLSVCMPCLILNSVIGRTGERDLATAGLVFAIAVVLYMVLLPVVSLILVKLLRMPKKQQGIYAFMFTFSNVGFMGFPLVNALYGSDAVFYTAIINIIFTVSSFTIGVMMMHVGQDTQAKLDPKVLLTPGVLLSLLAVVLYLLDLKFPTEIVSVTASIGNMTTPAAMLCIGSTLASMSVREVLNDWRVYLFSVIKQVLIPLALLPLLRVVVPGDFLQGLLYLLLLTPVANSAVLLATEHGFDEKLAAKGVFVSTVLSVVTIPLMAQLL